MKERRRKIMGIMAAIAIIMALVLVPAAVVATVAAVVAAPVPTIHSMGSTEAAALAREHIV